MRGKTYIIDTNVLVHDFHSFHNILTDNVVVIPYTVLEELDKLKSKNDEVGVNARNVIRKIEQEQINNNPRVIIAEVDNSIPVPDDRILEVCKDLREAEPTLVSKDVCLRTKARAFGIRTEDYKADKVEVSNLYTGMAEEIFVPADVVTNIYLRGEYLVEDIAGLRKHVKLYQNQAVTLVNDTDLTNRAYAIHKNGTLELIDNKVKPFDLTPANLEQQILVNHLLDPEVSLVTVTGAAGSGKTLVAVACALESVMTRDEYSKVTVARPIMPFQKDIGFLPGDIAEKVSPWFMPIVDNLDFLMPMAKQPKSKSGARLSAFEELQAQGILEMCPLTFIRGRSMPDQYIIVDEAQQVTVAEMKTILTRVGQGTKIVLTGDYSQIDNPYLSADSNGLVHCVEKFKDESIAAHISLQKCERSELAEISSKLL
jgi:PhoH-like ATPase